MDNVDNKNTEELKKYRQQLFELRLKEAYYVAEHHETSSEIKQEMKEVKKQYSKLLFEMKKEGK